MGVTSLQSSYKDQQLQGLAKSGREMLYRMPHHHLKLMTGCMESLDSVCST